MGKILNVLAITSLSYAIFMLLVDAAFSLLSLGQHTNIRALIEDRFIPYVISVASMIYCIIRIWKRKNK